MFVHNYKTVLLTLFLVALLFLTALVTKAEEDPGQKYAPLSLLVEGYDPEAGVLDGEEISVTVKSAWGPVIFVCYSYDISLVAEPIGAEVELEIVEEQPAWSDANESGTVRLYRDTEQVVFTLKSPENKRQNRAPRWMPFTCQAFDVWEPYVYLGQVHYIFETQPPEYEPPFSNPVYLPGVKSGI